MRWIGVDAHRDFAHVTEIGTDGIETNYRVELTAEGLTAFKARLGSEAQLVLEASTNTFRLVDELRPHAGRVVVAHPSQTRGASAFHAKTDKRDSKILAQLLAAGFVSEVWVPDADTRSLRGQIEHRQVLSQWRAATKQRMKSLLNQEMIRPSVLFLTGPTGRRFLKGLQGENPGCYGRLASLLRLHDAIDLEVRTIDRDMSKWCKASEEGRLLLTIPGIGAVVAATLLSQIGEVGRFSNPGKLCAYAGLVPRVHQSGKSMRIGAISGGRSLMRWALSIAVPHAVAHSGALQEFHRQLCERRPRMVAHVACARKLLIIIWHMLMKRRSYRDEDTQLTARKLS
jgi:transposase